MMHAKQLILLLSVVGFLTPITQVMAETSEEIDALWEQIDRLNQKVTAAEEWRRPNTLVHLAGFTGIGYESSPSLPGGSFSPLSFSPVFHYQYRDLVMLEAELDITVLESGGTDVGMEYLTADIFLNDNVALIMGKFLSPLGHFRQNLHPSWINKLPNAPTGFGHDQAAPNADVGAQLRGGFKMGGISANYAAFVGNGVSVELNGAGDEMEKIESPGMGLDKDNTKNYGGRFGLYFPESRLDIGLSLATGDTSERAIAAGGAITYANKRSWSFTGFDVTYQLSGLDVKAEYVAQTIGALAASGAPEAATFSAYYVQAAYRLNQSNWEPVLRVGSYTTPEGTNEQSTLGLNYIFVSNLVGKVALQTNSSAALDDKFLAQIAYGF